MLSVLTHRPVMAAGRSERKLGDSCYLHGWCHDPIKTCGGEIIHKCYNAGGGAGGALYLLRLWLPPPPRLTYLNDYPSLVSKKIPWESTLANIVSLCGVRWNQAIEHNLPKACQKNPLNCDGNKRHRTKSILSLTKWRPTVSLQQLLLLCPTFAYAAADRAPCDCLYEAHTSGSSHSS